MWRIQPHKFKYFPTGSTSIWLKMCWPSTQNLRIQNEGTWGRSHFWQRERPTIGGLFEWFNRFSQHQHHSTIKHLHVYTYISYRLYTYTMTWNIILCMSVYPSILGSGKKVSPPSWTKKSSHSSLQNLAIFRNISRDSKTKSDTYHHHSEKLWSSGYQFHPWTFKLLPWWPQVAICGSLSTFFLEHTSKHGTKNWTCCFNSVGKSRHDFVFKCKVYIPLLYK